MTRSQVSVLQSTSFHEFTTSSYNNPIRFKLFIIQLLVLLPFFIFSIADGTSVPTLPIVDLGYELHQAFSFNVGGLWLLFFYGAGGGAVYIHIGWSTQTCATTLAITILLSQIQHHISQHHIYLHRDNSIQPEAGLYNFSKIRYAEPPVGEIRFRASVPPRKNRGKIIDQGKIGRVCPQASPAWSPVAAEFLRTYFAGKFFNASAFDSALANSLSSEPPSQDPRVSEDCLFLNVIVPQNVFEQAAPHRQPLAPVLVWIHGGGYTSGEKTDRGLYNPAGLIKASQSSNSTGLVYVAINYRLGTFGWLSGPDLQADGTANAGLYDQQLALRWVQKYIKYFGGDANQVTVMGESAGGGSIVHQLTAFGGLDGPLPFQQAIIQSPGFLDVPDSFKQQQTFEKFLSLLNVKTIAEARKLPVSSLIAANSLQISQSNYGTSSYGIVPGGRFAPASARSLLRQGLFDKKVKLMVAHNANEGIYFTDPSIRTESAFINSLRPIPGISTLSRKYIANVLYPPIFDGSYGYTDQFTREVLLIFDIEFTCNTDYLNRAYEGKTYAYQFSVPPGLHGQDVPYTFYNNGPPSPNNNNNDSSSSSEELPNASLGGIPAVDQAIAEALQNYIVTFTATGVPSTNSSSSNNNKQLPPVFFPQWWSGTDKSEKNLLDLNNVTGIKVVKDETANSRCAWWQQALYY